MASSRTLRVLVGALASCTLAAIVAACSGTSAQAIDPGVADAGKNAADGSGTGSDAGGSGGGSTLEAGCAQQAAQICAHYKECLPTTFAILARDQADCEALFTRSCVYYGGVVDSQYTGNDAIACGKVYAATSCVGTISCAIVPGKRKTGAPCQWSASCASGYCAVAAAGTCGICVDTVAQGQACSTTSPCDRVNGMYCGPSNTCVPYGQAGADCGAPSQPLCTLGLSCVAGKCGTGGQLGDACDAMHPCDFTKASTCDIQNKCSAFPTGTSGDACGGTTKVSLCTGGSCVTDAGQSMGTCQNNLAEGAACDPKVGPRCAFIYTCGSAGKCALPEDLGCN